MVWTAGEGDPYIFLRQLLYIRREKPDAQGQIPQQVLAAHVAEQGGELPPLPEIARTERGKPYFPHHPELHFSLSHSGNLALCALADTPIGADLELVRPRKPGLPRYVLSDRERAWYEGRGSCWEDFYILWTLKEARVKCTGQGIFRRPAREISVPLLPGGETDWDGFRFTVIAGESQEEGDFFGAICQSPAEKGRQEAPYQGKL